jgi:hypothetical protein
MLPDITSLGMLSQCHAITEKKIIPYHAAYDFNEKFQDMLTL